jgi:hypothetical protein
VSGENWVLIVLIAAYTEYKTVAACLSHRRTQAAAARKAEADSRRVGADALKQVAR